MRGSKGGLLFRHLFATKEKRDHGVLSTTWRSPLPRINAASRAKNKGKSQDRGIETRSHLQWGSGNGVRIAGSWTVVDVLS